ncbi:MAG: hypothetical protein M1833_000603 [Piccolia ochrophora]|nr:MAG: hypothetical protein M1833_000603 [Piccolia ochrophora]
MPLSGRDDPRWLHGLYNDFRHLLARRAYVPIARPVEDSDDPDETELTELPPSPAIMVRGNLTGSKLRGAIAFCCGTAFLLFGYDQGVLGAVIAAPAFRATFDNPNEHLEGIFAAIYDIGCAVGALLAFVTAERFGRKGSVMWGSWIMVVGAILQTTATEKIQMILSRIVTGIGNGINTCAVPIWQAESFPAHNRGALLVIQSALIALGFPVSTFMGLAASKTEPSTFAWRWPIAFQLAFLAAILVTLPFLPESPRWLLAHDKVEEATDVLARLEGKGVLVTDEKVTTKRDMVLETVRHEREVGSASWAEVFTEGKQRNLSRVLLGVGPYMMNQWSGINCLAYFLPITFERNINLDSELSLILSGVLGVQYFFVSWLPYFFIERVGRRKVLMSSAGACSFCMVMLAVMLRVGNQAQLRGDDTTRLAANWTFVAFVFLFFDVFSLGILPVSWMYSSEIMPLRTRNKGVAMGVFSHWMSNFIIVLITPAAIRNLSYRLYIIWAVFNAAFVPITYFFYPETARRSLEDLDEVFLNEKFGVTRTRSPGTRRADQKPEVNPEHEVGNKAFE